MQPIKELCSSGKAKGVAVRVRQTAKRLMPVTSWAPRMTGKMAISDGIGGFIAGVMIVPTCLSWASLAGLNLSCGLSAAFFASLSYGTFGSCAVLSIGPVAEITTLLISISGIPLEKREQTFQSIGVQVGILSVLLSFIDGGKVIKTIFAKPVGDGYTCAAALLAICVQLKTMFNVTAPPATLIQDVLYQTIKAIIQQFSVKCIYCFFLFMAYCLYLIYIKKTRLPIWIPHQLLVVIVSTLVTYYVGLYQESSLNLAIVGTIPPGLKTPSFPPWENIIGLGPYTLTITMISFVQMYVIAQRVMPDINPNGELFASGVTNFLCNVMGGMPVTNSFSVSSVLMEQHVNTPLTAYVAATVLFITMMFLTRLGVFYYLPKQALGAIVVASVWRLVDFSGPMKLWQYSKKDAGVWVFTFTLTIFGGLTVGVLGGIALSLIIVVLRVARPRAVTVGFNMSTFRYGDISRDPELLVYPSILLWRFDAPLYFVNAGYFQEKLIKAIQAEVRPIDVVLVTCGKIVDIDAAALGALPGMIESIANADKTRPRRIILCDMHGRLEQVLHASEALPMFVPDEYDRLTIEQIEKTGKFPVVFKKLEDAIAFAQRCISERYGNVDTAPYPNVSFLTDLVVEAAKIQGAAGGSALATLFSHQTNEEGGSNDSGAADTSNTVNGLVEPSFAFALSRDTGGEGAASPATGQLGDGAHHNHMNIHLLQALEKLKKLSSYSPDRELIGMVGLIRNTEVTPRQKEKILFTEPALIAHAFRNDAALREPKRTPHDLEGLFQVVEELLPTGRLTHADSWRRVIAIARSNPPGLKMKIKAQPIFGSKDGSFASLDVGQQLQLEPHRVSDVQAARFVLKWGGVPTRSGITQAHVLGEKLFARFYAAGDLPMRRLLAFTRHPTVCASDDPRVISTALVVTNAITQSSQVTKEDINLDDDLMKTLSPTAKRLLHDEYKYFEALMHIDSHAAARHYFHIPCFRQLLLIPPLDRPLAMSSSGGGEDGNMNNGGLGSGGFPGVVTNPNLLQARSYLPSHAAAAAITNDWSNSIMDPFVDGHDSTTDISFFHGSRAASTQQNTLAAVRGQRQTTLANTDYYTPLEVLEELEKNIRTLIETPLPHEMLSLPLSNHETVREMQQRYRGMLRVLMGAKRRQTQSTRQVIEARRRRREQGLPASNASGGCASPFTGPMSSADKSRAADDDDGEESYEVDDGYASSDASRDPSHPAATDRSSGPNSGLAHLHSERTKEVANAAGGSSDSDNSSTGHGGNIMADVAIPPAGDAILDNGRGDGGVARPTAVAGIDEAADGGVSMMTLTADARGGERPRVAASAAVDAGTHLHPSYMQRAVALEGRATRSHTGTGFGSERTPSPARGPNDPPTTASHNYNSRGGRSPDAADSFRPVPAPHPPGFAPRLRQQPRYDLSDISKLRDYGSYDLSYNMHLLRGLHAVTPTPEVRRFVEALARVARLTDCMSRVGENVLEGVNSSKRFIIGSLVSGGLLESIFRDYTDFAKMDERKGVKELLFRAQTLYMTEKGGVEQDVQHFVKLFRRLAKLATGGSSSLSKKKSVTFEPIRGDEPQLDETPAEKEFRLRFPFISLPKEDTPAARKSSITRQKRGNHARDVNHSNNNTDDDASYARFYFTTYLHVEGALQCLFDSSTVDGFSRPSKEELEASQQLYMKHLIFKVFRRRNYSFTDAEGLAAFRKLHLLFRSDVDYGRQQRELRAALASIYHAMYYISMEVYLSLGDAEGVVGVEEAEGPLLVLDGEPGASGAGCSAGIASSPMGWEDCRVVSPSNDSPGSADGEDDDAGGDGGEENTAHAKGDSGGSFTSGSPPQRRAGSHPLGSAEPLPIISVTPASPSRPVGVGGASAAVAGGGGAGSDPHLGLPSPLSGSLAYSGGSGLSPPHESPSLLFGVPGRLNGTFASAGSPVSQLGSIFSPVSGTAPGSTAHGTAHSAVGGGADGAASPTVAIPVSPEASLAAPAPPLRKAKRQHSEKKTATVLMTPEAGRGTAAMQEMKNRVSSVTPMRRIHEGISIDEFFRLIKEVQSAILSQQSGI